jgi:hypothetical protein
MDKVKEMWEALTAYQPQADAAGHGATWAAMCKERTAGAAFAADAAACAAGAGNYAAADAADAAANAVDEAAAAAGKWAQRAIERINKVLVKLQHRSKTMSDVMLFGVLKMPYEMAMASELSRFQFYQRVQELVARVEVQPPLPVLAQEVTDAEVEKACHTAYVQHGPKDMRSVLEQFVKSRAAIAAAIASTKEGKL